MSSYRMLRESDRVEILGGSPGSGVRPRFRLIVGAERVRGIAISGQIVAGVLPASDPIKGREGRIHAPCPCDFAMKRFARG